MDLSTLNDEELAQHLNYVITEQERRQALAIIPDQIVELREKFLAGGGDLAELP